LTTTIAANDPAAQTYHGDSGGKLQASRSPAKNAEPSAMRGDLPMQKSNPASKATLNTIHCAMVDSAWIPKKNHPAMTAGKSATATCTMMAAVASGNW
jgi:hypothetical protein